MEKNTKRAWQRSHRQQNTNEYVLSRLSSVRKSGNGFIAKCPAHDDSKPSLSIKITDSGRLLLHCFAGCSFKDISDELGIFRGNTNDSQPSTFLPREKMRSADHLSAQQKAARLWLSGRTASQNHLYLLEKKIRSCHAKQMGDSLMIPLQDSRGEIWNIQFIDFIGSKRFLRGGLTKGLFTVVGETSNAERIYIAEGFATAATINELTGNPCFVAFCDTNLLAVALVVRKSFPDRQIVLASDADESGERYAKNAAVVTDSLICYARRG